VSHHLHMVARAWDFIAPISQQATHPSRGL
jgi:hypothetical protein